MCGSSLGRAAAMAAFGGGPGRRPPKPVAPSARPGAAGPDDPGWVQRSPSITVDHRPKLFLEGCQVEAWNGPGGREGPNPGLHGLEAAALPSYFQQPRSRRGCSVVNPLFLKANRYEASPPGEARPWPPGPDPTSWHSSSRRSWCRVLPPPGTQTHQATLPPGPAATRAGALPGLR